MLAPERNTTESRTWTDSCPAVLRLVSSVRRALRHLRAPQQKDFFIVAFTMFDVSFILSPSHAQRQCKPGAEANLSGSAEAPPIKARAYSPQRYKNFVNEMIPSNYFGEIPAAGRSGRGTGAAGRTVNAVATGSYTCRGRRVRSRNRASHWEPRPVPCRPRRRRLPTKASRR